MAKRIIASILGLLVLFAGLIAGMYAVDGFQDFWNPDVSFWTTAIGELIMGGIALTAFLFGLRFLVFAFRGRKTESKDTLARAILLGAGCFIPGFVFSLPFSILLAIHILWPGDAQSELGAIPISLSIGAVSAIICCTVLVKRRNARRAEI